ncbi:MAG: hypothetical protein IPO09_11630 [Anaeromyxobacter sp.]|nr:hypothetical protein [Anaeromyxobacter sp.]MBL0276905.1 hypothetical protein [Anaeromyxobacter sp.]
MDPEQTKSEALALSNAFFAECQVVAAFIDEKVRVAVDERAATAPHGLAFQVQLLRAIAWLRSLTKLNHPADFQAVIAAARALFEGAVDVTLMHLAPGAHSPEMMDAWEDSAKLKHAQTMAGYLAGVGRAPSTEEQTILNYATREKARVQALRSRWWPSYDGSHPPRWTGRDLATDSKNADLAAAGHLQTGYEEFYRLRYPQLCWNVHGSGAAGIANIAAEVFPFLGGRAYREAARFAAMTAEMVTRELKCFSEADFAALRETLSLTTGFVFVVGANAQNREVPDMAEQFKILKQADKDYGCIPACARSVLRHKGADVVDEATLVDIMWHKAGSAGSGFDRLKSALAVLGSKWELRIERPLPGALARRVTELNANGSYVLFPIGQLGAPAHCIVITESTLTEAMVHNPGDGAQAVRSWQGLERAWCGDIAYFVEK